MNIASLLSDQAQKFIRDHLDRDPVTIMLTQKSPPGVALRDLAQQIKARKIARDKIPCWFDNPRILFGESQSLEQSSSELTAIYKSQLVAGNYLVDLTGGLGVDSYFIGRSFTKVSYVEQKDTLCSIVKNNLKVLGANHTEVIHQKAEDFLAEMDARADTIYLDPDRRPEGNRKYQLEDCRPNVEEILPQIWKRSTRILLKLSPMLDLQSTIDKLGAVKEVHVVSVKNECKELIVLLEKDHYSPPRYVAVNFPTRGGIQSVALTKQEFDSVTSSHSDPLTYLYEPNCSLMKLGAFGWLSYTYGISKLHPNSHLFTSEHPIEGFPGRAFAIQWVIPYKPQEIRNYLKSGKANVAIRNFPRDVRTIRHECKLKDGGGDYLFCTTGPTGSLLAIGTKRIQPESN